MPILGQKIDNDTFRVSEIGRKFLRLGAIASPDQERGVGMRFAQILRCAPSDTYEKKGVG